jgi:molybdopterin-guanine dinucleotide biosynthesis protein A
MKTLAAVLFAGGESRRMGHDKATLTLNGEPLWSRQIRILRELHPAQLMISARNKPDWSPDGIEVILDGPPSHGPLSGLVAAFERIQTSHLLVLAVDLPQVTSAHLQKLWTLAEPGIGIIPQNEESVEPLCAIYPVECAGVARDALSKGEDVSLGGIIRTLAAQNRVCFYGVTQVESPLYQNINTPEQWKQVRA